MHTYTKDGISVIVKSAKNDPNLAKCLRCWKYTHECGYDRNNGCVNLLCNRCSYIVKRDFPNDPAVINYCEERKRIYGDKKFNVLMGEYIDEPFIKNKEEVQ